MVCYCYRCVAVVCAFVCWWWCFKLFVCLVCDLLCDGVSNVLWFLFVCLCLCVLKLGLCAVCDVVWCVVVLWRSLSLAVFCLCCLCVSVCCDCVLLCDVVCFVCFVFGVVLCVCVVFFVTGCVCFV